MFLLFVISQEQFFARVLAPLSQLVALLFQLHSQSFIALNIIFYRCRHLQVLLLFVFPLFIEQHPLEFLILLSRDLLLIFI